MSSVYPPKEDSYLLAEAVKKYAYGEALDVGTGSGIQAITAANNDNVTRVFALDINPEALEYAKKHNPHKKIRFIESDLFSNIKKTKKYDMSEIIQKTQHNSLPNDKYLISEHAQKLPRMKSQSAVFDTIIFNPPYLPDDERIKDVALDGGKKGYELTVKFLEQSKYYLEKDGQILLLFSSYTKKEVIDKCLKENLYSFEQISEQKIDFETLYVYKITKNDLLKKIEGYTNIKIFAKGKRGVVYLAEKNKKRYAIKIKREGSDAVSTLSHEGDFLKIVNQLGIGPELTQYDSEFVVMEFIDGIRIGDFFEKETKTEIKKALIKIFGQIRKLDINNIQKQEMSNPYKHIIITQKNKSVLIDFERARKKPLPANLTQFLDYLISNNTTKIFETKKILLDKKEIIKLATEYKNDQSENNYKKILNYVKKI